MIFVVDVRNANCLMSLFHPLYTFCSYILNIPWDVPYWVLNQPLPSVLHFPSMVTNGSICSFLWDNGHHVESNPRSKCVLSMYPRSRNWVHSLEIKSWERGLLSSQMLSPPWLQNHSNMSYQFDNLKINDVQRLLPCAKFVDVLLKQNNEPINF
jgi:hypothetical protein